MNKGFNGQEDLRALSPTERQSLVELLCCDGAFAPENRDCDPEEHRPHEAT